LLCSRPRSDDVGSEICTTTCASASEMECCASNMLRRLLRFWQRNMLPARLRRRSGKCSCCCCCCCRCGSAARRSFNSTSTSTCLVRHRKSISSTRDSHAHTCSCENCRRHERARSSHDRLCVCERGRKRGRERKARERARERSACAGVDVAARAVVGLLVVYLFNRPIPCGHYFTKRSQPHNTESQAKESYYSTHNQRARRPRELQLQPHHNTTIRSPIPTDPIRYDPKSNHIHGGSHRPAI